MQPDVLKPRNVIFISGEAQPLRLAEGDRRFKVVPARRRCKAPRAAQPAYKRRGQLERRFNTYLATKRLRFGRG